MNYKISSTGKYLLLVSSVIFFLSCINNSKNDEAFKILDESLVNSSQIIRRSNEMIYSSLNTKLSDPSTHYKAEIWYPKAMQIQKLSADITDYIEQLKVNTRKEGELNNDESNKLYNQLIKYKNDIMHIDSEMTAVFDTTIILTTRPFDTKKDKKDFTKTFFENISTEAAISILTTFQNNIKIIENKLIVFCHDHCNGDRIIDDFTSFSAIVAQTSTNVKGGEKIEITAGIGAFSRNAKPIIMINGKSIQPSEDGAAYYKFKTSNKSGKHFIPVEISYTDQDGKRQTIRKNVEYTVVDY